MPTHRFAWESYHSELNQVSGIVIPAPALCEQLRLSNRQTEWDLYDAAYNVASVYRQFKSDHDMFASHLSYLRCDLLASYLAETGQTLAWFVWGERELHHRSSLGQMDELHDIWRQHQHIHKQRASWAG